MSVAPQPSRKLVFNPMLPEYRADPRALLAELRRDDPIHHSSIMDVWVLTRYADVVAALREPKLSAAARHWRGFERFFLRPGVGANNVLVEMYGRWMLQLDGDDHARLRALLNGVFTPRTIEHMRNQITQIVERLLDDGLNGKNQFDAVADLAYPLPIIVICQMLGIPAADHDRVKDWCEQLLPSFSPAMSLATLQNVNRSLDEFRAYFAELVQIRRREPGLDLLSGLIAAQIGDDRFSDEELFSTSILLAFAGHVTTAQAASNMLLLLAKLPEHFDAIRTDPKRLNGAIEESLRVASPLQLVYRTTLEPWTIGGKTIPAGEMVLLSLIAANHDPERFPDPDRFDPARTDNRHVAFGYGSHFCAGAGLARLELQCVLNVFARRFSAWSLDGIAEPPREPSVMIRGIQSLPLRVTKRGEG